jgi:spermidine synthase
MNVILEMGFSGMNVYLGTFLIAFSTLALEITLSRLLSVVTWYHLAFFAVSTAMLGMTAGAVVVYLRPGWFSNGRLNRGLAKSSLWYMLITPFSLIMLCILPITFVPSIMSVVVLLFASIACSLPFYFSGMAVSAVLTKSALPIGKLYASDLAGASLGCLFVLAGLWVMDATSLIFCCGAVGGLAALAFARRDPLFRHRRLCAISIAILVLVAGVNSVSMYGIRPLVAKNEIQNPRLLLMERWNTFSRVALYKGEMSPPQYWGRSPVAPQNENVLQYYMNIDGDAATTLQRFSSLEDIAHLRYDVTNVAYYLRPHGNACVIGVGGGRDVQSAIFFGHETVTGIDVNPIFIDLVKNKFREFAGIAGHKGVTLVADEARSYLTRNRESFSTIQMSLIDTWASTGAGAYSLSENSLYTIEAWQVFLSRLSDDGIFTVSRWHDPDNLGETGRMISLAMASLFKSGVTDPSRHIALVTADKISTLILSKRPLGADDLEALLKTVRALRFTIAILPGKTPENPILRDIISARSPHALHDAIAGEPYNLEPSTDERPYFFNMFRLDRLNEIFSAGPGVTKGNATATLVLLGLLLSLAVLTIATIVVPLAVAPRLGKDMEVRSKIIWPGAIYFSLIGAGFMCVEIALIQRLSVFLGHPVYALGILLFTIIASTGIGSLISERLPLRSRWIVFALPVVSSLAIIAVRFGLTALMTGMITAPVPTKILLSIAVIFPLGLFLGFFFPTGMKMLKLSAEGETPWYWALNGIFGVLCSAIAVFISIYGGISINFSIGAACYAALVPCLMSMRTIKKQPTINEK